MGKKDAVNAILSVLQKVKDGDVSARMRSADLPPGFESLGAAVNELLDAVERRMREKEEPQERYRKILDTIHETYYEVDLRGHIIFFNKAFLHNLGYEEQEALGVSFRKLMDEENAARVFHAFRQVYLTGEPHSGFPFVVKRRDGSTLEVEASIDLLRDDEGNPVGFYGVTRDISERRRLERERAELSDRYQTVLDILDQAYVEVDLRGNVTFLNDAACRIIGMSREEFVGTNFRQFLPPASARKLRNLFVEIYQSGNRCRYVEIPVIMMDGTERLFEVHAALMRDQGGRPVGFQVLTTDVTEYRKALRALEENERRYRMIVESMSDTIWLFDLHLNKDILMSAGELPLTGYTPEELATMKLEDLILPEYLPSIKHILEEEYREEERGELAAPYRTHRLEILIRGKNGEALWEEITAKIVRDEEGTPVGVLLVGRNIDQRKRAEEEHEKIERQLLQAQKLESVGRLAGGVAHDFNNVLTVILGSIDVLKVRISADNPAWAMITEIEQAALRARDITKQLLAFSRRQIVKPVPINLNQVVERIQKTLSRLIGEDVTIYYHQAPDLWTVEIDPLQVEQILMNLVINARDALPAGGTITIETMNVTLDEGYCREHLGFTPGEYALLSVSDNGIGIAADVLPQIFDPYFTTKGPDRGTGLGLATVYGIVKQNRGFVNVYSEEGRGTTFKIYLPRCEMQSVRKEEEQPMPIISRPCRVLVVEDDESVREVAVQMLQILGYEVQAVPSPQQAIALVLEDGPSFDVVLTDVIMPGMTGKEMMEHVERIKRGPAFVFMSGYTADVIAHHGVLEPGRLYLQKPFSLVELATQINRALSQET